MIWTESWQYIKGKVALKGSKNLDLFVSGSYSLFIPLKENIHVYVNYNSKFVQIIDKKAMLAVFAMLILSSNAFS